MEQTPVKEDDASTEYGTVLKNEVRNLTKIFDDEFAQLVEKANLSSKHQLRCLQEQISALEIKLHEHETNNKKEIDRIMQTNVSLKQSEEDIRHEYDEVLKGLSKEKKANEELRLNLQLFNIKQDELLLDLQTKEKELESKSNQCEVLSKELSTFMASILKERPHLHNADHDDDASAEVVKKTEEVTKMEVEIESLNRELLASRTRELMAIAKSPEDMRKICVNNELTFVKEMDFLQQEISQKEEEIKKLNISLQFVQSVSNEDRYKLNRQLKQKEGTIIILKHQKELLQTRVNTAKETVKLLKQEAAATTDVFSEPSPQLKYLIEKDVQLEQNYKKTQEDLHDHERCHDGTTTLAEKTLLSEILQKKVNELEQKLKSIEQSHLQETPQLKTSFINHASGEAEYRVKYESVSSELLKEKAENRILTVNLATANNYIRVLSYEKKKLSEQLTELKAEKISFAKDYTSTNKH